VYDFRSSATPVAVENSGESPKPSKAPRIRSMTVIFLPLCGRKPWLAREFRTGQGPRAAS
jgi:hypothetical protein